ncbi:MAG: adenosylmethionine decarboxylase [Candidatus Aenigmatarchaeota archaeon]
MVTVKHLLLKIEGCNKDLLSDEKFVIKAMEDIANVLDVKVIKKLVHVFKPGLSIILLIAESHIAFHSWPEYEMADIEIVTCKETSDLKKALKIIVEKFKPKKVVKRSWIYKL